MDISKSTLIIEINGINYYEVSDQIDNNLLKSATLLDFNDRKSNNIGLGLGGLVVFEASKTFKRAIIKIKNTKGNWVEHDLSTLSNRSIVAMTLDDWCDNKDIKYYTIDLQDYRQPIVKYYLKDDKIVFSSNLNKQLLFIRDNNEKFIVNNKISVTSISIGSNNNGFDELTAELSRNGYTWYSEDVIIDIIKPIENRLNTIDKLDINTNCIEISDKKASVTFDNNKESSICYILDINDVELHQLFSGFTLYPVEILKLKESGLLENITNIKLANATISINQEDLYAGQLDIILNNDWIFAAQSEIE